MAAELTIKDWTADNLANTNFVNPYRAVKLDTTNSDAVKTGVVLPAAGGDPCIGIVYETSKLDPTGAVVANSGVVIRSWGIARASVSAATVVGDMLKISNSAGQVAAQARNAAWQNVPIVGYGLTSSAVAGDRPLVMLNIGQIV